MVTLGCPKQQLVNLDAFEYFRRYFLKGLPVFLTLGIISKKQKKQRWRKHPPSTSLPWCSAGTRQMGAQQSLGTWLPNGAAWAGGEERGTPGCWRMRLSHELCFLAGSLQYHSIVQIYCWMEQYRTQHRWKKAAQAPVPLAIQTEGDIFSSTWKLAGIPASA